MAIGTSRIQESFRETGRRDQNCAERVAAQALEIYTDCIPESTLLFSVYGGARGAADVAFVGNVGRFESRNAAIFFALSQHSDANRQGQRLQIRRRKIRSCAGYVCQAGRQSVYFWSAGPELCGQRQIPLVRSRTVLPAVQPSELSPVVRRLPAPHVGD